MNEKMTQKTTEYRSFLVRFQRDCCPDDPDPDWRIRVRSVADGTEMACMTLRELLAYFAHATQASKEKPS